jgi:hypothetical protein
MIKILALIIALAGSPLLAPVSANRLPSVVEFARLFYDADIQKLAEFIDANCESWPDVEKENVIARSLANKAEFLGGMGETVGDSVVFHASIRRNQESFRAVISFSFSIAGRISQIAYDERRMNRPTHKGDTI